MSSKLAPRRDRGARRRRCGAALLLVHPAHLIVLFFVVVFGLGAGLGWMLLAMFATDVALATVAARLPPVRRWIDRRQALLAHRRLLARMDADHRAELAQLEQAASEVRALPAAAGAAALDLDVMIGTYARVAVACADSRRLLSRSSNVAAVDGRILAVAVEEHGPAPLRARRAELTALRADCHQRARRDTDELEQQLGLLADAVLLVHQQAIACTCRQHASVLAGDIDQLARALRDGAGVSADAQAELEALSAGE
jgi:hypothetical protein